MADITITSKNGDMNAEVTIGQGPKQTIDLSNLGNEKDKIKTLKNQYQIAKTFQTAAKGGKRLNKTRKSKRKTLKR